jgi:hypothetical protein
LKPVLVIPWVVFALANAGYRLAGEPFDGPILWIGAVLVWGGMICGLLALLVVAPAVLYARHLENEWAGWD